MLCLFICQKIDIRQSFADWGGHIAETEWISQNDTKHLSTVMAEKGQ